MKWTWVKESFAAKSKCIFFYFSFLLELVTVSMFFSFLLDICVKFAVSSESDETSYFDETFLFKKISCMCNQVLCLFY